MQRWLAHTLLDVTACASGRRLSRDAAHPYLMRECLSHMMEVGLARIEPRAVRTFGGHSQMDVRMIGICMERQHIGVIVPRKDPGGRLGGVLQRLGIGRTAGLGEVQRQRAWRTAASSAYPPTTHRLHPT